MPTIQGTITQAAPRFIPRRDGSGEFPLYEVWIDGQGPFVARKDVFNIAQMLTGQFVEAVTRSEQKGQYLNHYVDFVSQVQGGAAQQPAYNPAQQAQQAQPRPQQQSPGPLTTPDATYQTAASVINEADERKTESIHRQTATKVAALISRNQQEFWFNVEDLVIFYRTGVRPGARHALSNQDWSGATPQPQPQAQEIPRENRQNADAYRPYTEYAEPQFIPREAMNDPGPQGIPHDDQDIPF